MQTVDGKVVYTELAEVVAPQHTALLMIDIQGKWDTARPERPAIVARIARVLQAAREAGVMVVYFRNVQLPGHRTASPPTLRMWLKVGYRPGISPLYDLPGSDAYPIVAAVAPRDGEPLIDKRRASAFAGTQLDLLLRSNGIESVALVGGSTDWCVEATLWDTTSLDYYGVVLADCVHGPRPDGHDAALKQAAVIADVATSDEVISVWKNGG